MLKSLKKLKTDMRAAQRKEVVDLVGKIARQVIRAELALQPVQLLALVEEALAVMPPSRDQVEVFLIPKNCKRVSSSIRSAPRNGTCCPTHARAGRIRVQAGRP